MPLIDQINRVGLDTRSVLTGPTQLKPRRSRGSKGLASRWGLTDLVDEYEIGISTTGTGAGTYIVSVLPYSQNGLRPILRNVGRVLLITRVNGIAVPTGPITLLSQRRPSADNSRVVLPSRVAAAGDQLWVLVELTGSSSCRYRLEVDYT